MRDDVDITTMPKYASGYAGFWPKGGIILNENQTAIEKLNLLIVLRPDYLDYGTVYEEFFHTGQNLFYVSKTGKQASVIQMETEAKIAKTYEFYTANKDMSANDLRDKMVDNGFSDYELKLLFVEDATNPGNYVFNSDVKKGFDIWNGSFTSVDQSVIQLAKNKFEFELEKWSKTLNSNPGDPYYNQASGQTWNGDLDYLEHLLNSN